MLKNDLKTLVEDYERSLIRGALEAAGGNQRRAAAALGTLPTTLCEKMKRLGLRDRPHDGDDSPEDASSAAGRAT